MSKKTTVAKFSTPAAKKCRENGEETFTITVPKRYPSDKSRYLKAGNCPDVIIPTEEEVEVSLNEYYELKNSISLRKKTSRMLEKLRKETADRSSAL